MTRPISQFFERLGVPLKNTRWSWGARTAGVVVLRTWADEYDAKTKPVLVLREPGAYRADESPERAERLEHVLALWTGGLAGFAVIAMVDDPRAFPRVIKSYREDGVFPIQQLMTREDGAVMAQLGRPVSAEELHTSSSRRERGSTPSAGWASRTADRRLAQAPGFAMAK